MYNSINIRVQRTYLGLAVLCSSYSVWAVPVAFTNEFEFIAAVDAQGYVYVLESFEDDEVWGTVRSTIVVGSSTAPAITNFGVRFSANTNSSEITTSQGPPRTGEWGAYSLPHGSYGVGTNCTIPGNCGDGLLTSSDQPMYAFSAWVNGTHGGKLDVILNGDRLNPVDFPEICDSSGENCINYSLISPQHKFFGVLDPDGFTSCELREIEGTAEDQKFIFCDDFTIALSNAPCPLIRNLSVTGETAMLRFKGLAIHASYTLEASQSLVSNNWSGVDIFSASTTETNRTIVISNDLQNSFFRLRSP